MQKDTPEQTADFRGRLQSATGTLKNLLIELDSTRLHKATKSRLRHERKCLEAALKELVRPKPMKPAEKELLIEEWNQK